MYLIQARQMNTRNILTILFEIAVLLFLSVGVYGEEPTLLIENARVIVGDGTVKDAATVVIAGDRIQSVSTSNPQLKAAKRIDSPGRTLMPGLIDTHIHFGLTGQSRVAFRKQVETSPPKYLKDFIQHGVTTVKSLGDPLDLVLELRTMVNEGNTLGPRILLVGPNFTAPGGHPVATMGQDEGAFEVDDENAARKEVRRLHEKGVDAIKAVLEGGGGWEMPDKLPRLSANVLRAIVDEAHKHKLAVTVHTHREQDVIDAVEAGADGVEHGVSDAKLSDNCPANLLLERNVNYTPTLWIMRIGSLASGSKSFEITKQNLKFLSDKGVRISLGTDTLCSMPRPGLNTIQEMEFMVEAGLTPEKVIRAATRNAAEHLGLLEDLGTIEPGKIADLIIIDGDPLKDISSLHQIQMVIKAGRIVHDVDAETTTPKGIPSDSNPVGWFEIPVTDMARAKAFYEHVLNLKLQPMNFGPLEMAFFPMRPGATGAAGALMKGEAFQPSQQGVQIYFTALDIDAALERVQERGGKVVFPKTRIGPFGFVASFEDSEGNRIGLRSSQ
ncbi:MAG: amidohydrolase family protein [Planctomycetota bacterium]|jgi:imidazolonepropionase-like amidohydrolase/predicted enzyme related to lactoylglutathione lyase